MYFVLHPGLLLAGRCYLPHKHHCSQCSGGPSRHRHSQIITIFFILILAGFLASAHAPLETYLVVHPTESKETGVQLITTPLMNQTTHAPKPPAGRMCRDFWSR